MRFVSDQSYRRYQSKASRKYSMNLNFGVPEITHPRCLLRQGVEPTNTVFRKAKICLPQLLARNESEASPEKSCNHTYSLDTRIGCRVARQDKRSLQSPRGLHLRIVRCLRPTRRRGLLQRQLEYERRFDRFVRMGLWRWVTTGQDQ